MGYSARDLLPAIKSRGILSRTENPTVEMVPRIAHGIISRGVDSMGWSCGIVSPGVNPTAGNYALACRGKARIDYALHGLGARFVMIGGKLVDCCELG